MEEDHVLTGLQRGVLCGNTDPIGNGRKDGYRVGIRGIDELGEEDPDFLALCEEVIGFHEGRIPLSKHPHHPRLFHHLGQGAHVGTVEVVEILRKGKGNSLAF
jgi:hypothetical protein